MSEPTLYQCPTCDAQYRVVRVEAPAAQDQHVSCVGCDGALQAHDGQFALKYFRTGGKRRTKARGRAG